MSYSKINSTCVVVPQETFGVIGPIEGCPQKISTFGCGPCIGILLIRGNVVGLAHVSSSRLLKGLYQMIITMLEMIYVTSPDNIEKPTFVHLIGGENNEKTKMDILDIIFDDYVMEEILNPIMVSDRACKYPNISNIMYDA